MTSAGNPDTTGGLTVYSSPRKKNTCRSEQRCHDYTPIALCLQNHHDRTCRLSTLAIHAVLSPAPGFEVQINVLIERHTLVKLGVEAAPCSSPAHDPTC